MTNFLLAQIFIGISSTIYGLSLLLKNKTKLLFLQIISCCFFVTQYFLLGAYIGGIVAGLEMIRCIVFYFIDKKFNTNKVRITSCVIFCILGLLSAIFTWENWFSILPLLGLLAVTICLAFKNVISLKIACIFSALCAFAYMIFYKSYFGCATQLFIAIVGISGLIVYLIKNKKQPLEKDNEKESV